jgi:hypothetical protein
MEPSFSRRLKSAPQARDALMHPQVFFRPERVFNFRWSKPENLQPGILPKKFFIRSFDFPNKAVLSLFCIQLRGRTQVRIAVYDPNCWI